MSPKVTLVTGGNRGIGLEICRGILLRAAQSKSPNVVVIGSRSLSNSTEPIAELTPLANESNSTITAIVLDITSDSSIESAVEEIQTTYGKLDVLVNNAGYGVLPPPNATPSQVRAAYTDTLNTNLSSVAIMIELFLPLLLQSSDPRIITVSSARGSFTINASPSMAPTRSLAYSVSKAAVNMLTLDYSKRLTEKGVKVWSTSPGFCRTRFNGFQGTKDPADGAKSIVELACCEEESAKKYEVGRMWEFEEGGMRIVPW